MTLIAGFVCADGLVLCADTEEATSYTRGHVRKLLPHVASNGAVIAVAGAGDGAFLDAAVDQVFDAVDASGASTLAEFQNIIRKSLIHFHQQEVASAGVAVTLELIGALRSTTNDLALVKASATALSRVPEFALSGSGAVLLHVVEELYQPTISVYRGIPLAIHLLSLGKRYVPGVGGDSHILTLTASGPPYLEPLGEVRIKERYLQKFNKLAGDLLLQFPDASIEPTVFMTRMTEATQAIDNLRGRQAGKLAVESIKHMPPGGHPRKVFPPGSIIRIGDVPDEDDDELPQRSLYRSRRRGMVIAIVFRIVDPSVFVTMISNLCRLWWA